ncbi:lytic transglycosylase [Corallococcus praedator]|uniref:Lytic transglycosylase n=1 Tax=Corallococcus praedator TaxID=2316724 RepID=A0ABX9QS21_9BACT|nr:MULTISPECIES: transglycosylase SLT domain-containing protein [Corallococcus]RKH21782.1 lytic transglycosylase [Corallococcus sp. CA047B]RKH36544.1 lytic transglycosylase [Corallococcus sp. CA031C]RKI17744.1 lytic transglycosylase [Corallococcus praedator]
MALSPVSNRSVAFRAPSQDVASRPEGVSGPRAQGCFSPRPGSNVASQLQQDGFSAGPQKGAEFKQFMEGLSEVVKGLQQLTQMLQASGIGEAPSLGGEDGAEGVSGAEGASSASGASGAEGASSASGPSSAGDSYQAGPTEAAGASGEAPQGQVGDWIKQAQKLLAAAGIPADKMNAQDIAKIVEHESSGNPSAINLTDQNAKDGHPSIGLMQTIQPTFDAFKLPGHDDIRNPVDNIVAAVRYAVDRYGSVSNTPGIKGLNGGSGYVGY